MPQFPPIRLQRLPSLEPCGISPGYKRGKILGKQTPWQSGEMQISKISQTNPLSQHQRRQRPPSGTQPELQPLDPTPVALSRRSHPLGRSHKSHFPSSPTPGPFRVSIWDPDPGPRGATLGGESSHPNSSWFQPRLFLGRSRSGARAASGVPGGRCVPRGQGIAAGAGQGAGLAPSLLDTRAQGALGSGVNRVERKELHFNRAGRTRRAQP